MEPITIKINPLTPIWTGGVDGKCDRLHETGIIGSLRWWYEAIVRGLGGYACDPTSDDRCEPSGEEKDIEEIKKNLCPACYIFGCTGWKRRFRLILKQSSKIPLHFRSSISLNKEWLRRIFGAENQRIDGLNAFYGDIIFELFIGSDDEEYIKNQLVFLWKFISKYGGIGAKLQHGFGQFSLLEPEMNDSIIRRGSSELKERFPTFKSSPDNGYEGPYNLKYFVSLDYNLLRESLSIFFNRDSHIGSPELEKENRYIPCAFDFKYKGSGKFGMRQWLKEKNGDFWNESNSPEKLNTIDKLLGPRSEWKDSRREWQKVKEDMRTASRLYFGMPYKLGNGNYRLRLFGFAPGFLAPDDMKELCEEYMDDAFQKQAKKTAEFLGREIAGE